MSTGKPDGRCYERGYSVDLECIDCKCVGCGNHRFDEGYEECDVDYIYLFVMLWG